MTEIAVLIGRNIAQAREVAGISQRELARRVGVSSPTMTYWERGQYQPTAGALLDISRACAVSVLFLYGLSADEGCTGTGSRLGGWRAPQRFGRRWSWAVARMPEFTVTDWTGVLAAGPVDFPRAWEIARSVPPSQHPHPKCSFRQTDGGLLCDCSVLFKHPEVTGGAAS